MQYTWEYVADVDVNPAGTRLFVANSLGRATVIDTLTHAVQLVFDDPSVSMDGVTTAVAVDPAGRAYFGFNADISASLFITDPATDQVSGGGSLGLAGISAVAVSPTGNYAFASMDGRLTAKPLIRRLDIATNTFTGEALVGGRGVAVDPTGSRVVAVNNTSDTVSVVDAATMQVIGSPIPVGTTPIGFGKFIGPAPPARSPAVHWYYHGNDVGNPAVPIGTTAVWRVTPGAGVDGVAYPATLPNGWSGAGAVADASGDGVPDVLWFGPFDGSIQPISRWIMDSAGNVAATEPVCDCEGAVAEWGLGDLDSDGRADLVARSASGQLLVGYMPVSGAISSWRDYGSVPQQWSLRGVADLNGDGIADLVWFRPSDGVVAIWLMQPDGSFNAAFPASAGTDWRPYKVADFDGDGKADIWWRHADGTNAVWYMNGGVIDDADYFVGAPLDTWTLGAATDVNFDHRADLLWYSPADGSVVRWTMNGRHLAPVFDQLPSAGPGWQIVQ